MLASLQSTGNMANPASESSLSVVIAAWPDTRGLYQCLSALEPQVDGKIEVLVVSSAPKPQGFSPPPPWLRWQEAPPGLLIPHLWSLGMKAARGDVIAITTTCFTPANDWLQQIREAHTCSESAGVGGPIDPPTNWSTVDWATYFLRYSNYFHYDHEHSVADIAGDNASYKRDSLDTHWESVRDGFWEPDFHRLLLAEGKTLTFNPQMRVRQRHSLGFFCFLHQRLRHGRQFGQARMRGRGLARRALGVASAPLIPAVFLAKITAKFYLHH